MKEPIWDYIEQAKKSLFRFEGLQDYSAEDGEEGVKIFIETGKLPIYSDDANEWWRGMKDKNQKGILTQRVRLVILPLTDYTKFELAYMKEAAEFSGDDIRIIKEEDFKKIVKESLPDFWMIDDQYVFLMEYGEKGKYIESCLVEGINVEKYIHYKNELLKRAGKIADKY